MDNKEFLKEGGFINTEHEPNFYMVINGFRQPLLLTYFKKYKTISVFDKEEDALKYIKSRKKIDEKFHKIRRVIKVSIKELK